MYQLQNDTSQCLKGTKRPNIKHVIHFDIEITVSTKKILDFISIIIILISQQHDNILFLSANVITTARVTPPHQHHPSIEKDIFRVRMRTFDCLAVMILSFSLVSLAAEISRNKGETYI